ncbi:rhotekin-like isoform X2 [Acanthaster planci]|uniref:Rhotekin-like isoform X2 n=1 Tax=Acanthaster planci TaxID=133434 RepID=A0A8B7XKR6_ACAPL|nr:rhotekin-like isoform X2 [Acanthaster planci]
MAFAGRQFQSLRRSFRRSIRKRTYNFDDPITNISKKRRSEGDENVELQCYSCEEPPSSPMRLWSGSKNMDNTTDIVEDLDIFYVRQLAISLQDYELQRKIDLEIKMREGTRKLLAACNRELHLLEAAKALLVSNTRVLAYMSELQRRKTAQYVQEKNKKKGSSRGVSASSGSSEGSGSECGSRPACKGKIAVSDIRIPLFWKDVDHIKNRGDHHRYAIFCLLKIGTEINSTQLVTNVDRTATDVTFEDSFVFENVSPDFQFTFEVYSYNLHDDMTMASTPQKLRRKINSFSNSVGKTVGRKLQGSLSTGSSEESANPEETPRFRLVAQANLTVDDINPVTKTHDLSLETDDTARSHCLPLFGNFCCRLAAQPSCMAQILCQGILHLQENQAGLANWRRNLWGVLRDGHLKVWDKAEDMSINADPIHTIPVSKDTVVSLSTESSATNPHVLEVSRQEGEERHHLAAESQGELERWRSSLEQLIVDQGAWLDACHTSVDILATEPRRPSMDSDRTGSLYDEMSISTDLTSQDESDDESVFTDSPAMNLRPRPLVANTKTFKKPIFTIPKILVRRETNV